MKYALAQDTGMGRALQARSVRPGTLGLYFAVVAALWLTQHQYAGIEQDARLYLLLALDALRPDLYANDVFVAFGSQGDFTLFTPLAAAAIHLAGSATRGMFFVWLVSYPIFVAGIILLCRRLLPTPWWALSVGLVLLWPGDFGIQGFLSYDEMFATPRIAAEGLTLVSLALWLSGRRPTAIIIVLVAAALHPLMAAPGLAVILLSGLPARRQWATACCGVALLGLFALLSPHIAQGPFGVMDAEWLHVVRLRTPYLFLDTWDLADWGRVACPVALLVIALGPQEKDGTLSRLLSATVLVALLGLAATLLCVDLVPNVLITQAQPWRAVWLAKLIAVAMAPAVAAKLWRAGPPGRTTGLLMLAGWLASPIGGACVALAAMVTWLARRHVPPTSWPILLRGAATVMTIVIAWSLVRSLLLPSALIPFVSGSTLARLIRSTMEDGAIAAAVLLLAWWLLLRRPGPAILGALATACGALAVPSAVAWSVAGTAPASLSRQVALRARIPPGSQVYWPDHPVETWLLLERPSYLSPVQETASLFSRQAAMTILHRAPFANALGDGGDIVTWRDRARPATRISGSDLARACSDTTLAFILLPKTALAHGAGDGNRGTTATDIDSEPALVDCGRVRATGDRDE